jgi:hypothetical protein
MGGARIAVVVEVAVRDEDAADVAEREAGAGEACVQGVPALFGADARVEEGDAAALLLDDVDVGGSARLGERHRNRNPLNPEASQTVDHLSFFTSSDNSGSALKRSATRP